MDRNFASSVSERELNSSPPARVAWIETISLYDRNGQKVVATREGGVDRNNRTKKFDNKKPESPPARVAWIETQD